MKLFRSIRFLTILALLASFLLAASLSALNLQGGLGASIPPLLTNRFKGFTEDLTALGELIFKILEAFLILVLLATPFFIYHSLRNKKGRLTLLSYPIAIITILIILWVAYQIISPDTSITTGPDEVEMGGGALLDLPLGEAPDEPVVPETPGWLGRAMAIGLALLITFGAAVLFKLWKGEDLNLSESERARERLAEQALEALTSLQSGEDLKDVIIRCYQQMSQTLEDQKKLHRNAASTPREFEHQLVRAGLPRRPVHTLTQLFEDVRYGKRPTGLREQNLALGSLTEIVDFCKLPQGAGLEP